MANSITSIEQLIDLWKTTEVGRKRRGDIALAKELKTNPTTVRSMRHRGNIAVRHWPAILAAAKRHAKDPNASPLFAQVDAELLMRLSTARDTDSAPVSGQDLTPIAA